MKGSVTMVTVSLLAGISYGLYQLSYEVQRMEAELGGLNRDILDNLETIEVLKAEWSYLGRPDELQDLAGRYLLLTPVAPGQVSVVATLPVRMKNAGREDAFAANVPLPRAKPGRPEVQPAERHAEIGGAPDRAMRFVTYRPGTAIRIGGGGAQ